MDAKFEICASKYCTVVLLEYFVLLDRPLILLELFQGRFDQKIPHMGTSQAFGNSKAKEGKEDPPHSKQNMNIGVGI